MDEYIPIERNIDILFMMLRDIHKRAVIMVSHIVPSHILSID